jgi:cytochrome c oxidase subunit 2
VQNPSVDSPRMKPRKSPLPFLAALLVAGLASGCQLPTFGAYRGSTVQGREEFRLWVGMAVAAIAVGVLVWGLIFWSVFRYRARRGDAAIPRQFSNNLIVEVIYTAIPLAIIGVISYFTVVTEDKITAVAANPPLKVHVIAFQWGWEFRYVEYQGKKIDIDVVGNYNQPPVAPLPAGETVRVILTSNDVVHGFYVPAFNFSRYAQPGFTNIFDLNIVRPGLYRGRCSQLCGVYHTQMLFTIKAMTQEQFDLWVRSHAGG